MKQSHHDGGNMGFETKIKEKNGKQDLLSAQKRFLKTLDFPKLLFRSQSPVMIESSSSRGSFFSFLSFLPLGLRRFPFSFLLFFIFYPPVLRMIVTVRRLGGVGDAMAGMVGSVFRMIVWLVGRLKSIHWWGGGGERSMGYAYSYTTRGLCRWKLVIRIELEDLGK